MKITKRQLKQIIREEKNKLIAETRLRRTIREAIGGHVHGDPEKESFLQIAMSSVDRGDYVRAADAIMNSYWIDDTWPEEEQALVDMLMALPPGARADELEAIAEEWIQGKRSGAYRR
jgi:hypothetical protein